MALVRYPAKGSGGGGSGSNVTGLSYDTGTEVLTLTTDQPGLFTTNIPQSDIQINDTIFVDAQFGNDGTATIESLSNKYQTLPAALAAWSPGLNIHCFPGNYILDTTFSLNDLMRIYLEPGAKILTTVSTAFSIGPGNVLRIDGDGEIDLTSSLFTPSSPTSGVPFEVYFNGKALNCSGAGQIIGDTTTGKVSIRTDFIGDGGFVCEGWTSIFIACDVWRKSSNYMFLLGDLEQNDGPTLVGSLGPRIVTVKGNNAARCQFENLTQSANCIYTQTCRMESWTSVMYLFVDFRSKDGFFFNHGQGTVYHDGDLRHSKSDTAGNEVPWYYSDQQPEEQYKPKFIHVRGSYVSATDVTFGGSLNNEIFYVRFLCDIEFNGKYQNSGENSGLGAWPILYTSNQSPNAGQTTIVLNGDFKSLGGDVSPIRFVDAVNDPHTFKWIVKNTAIQTRATYSIDTNIAMRIYVYHSLVMDKNYNPLISDGLSEDRTIVDENITVDVPEYGI